MALDVKNICTEQWRLYDLDALISIAEDDIADAITKKQIQTCKDYTNIVLRTAGKAVVTMREILQLSAHGYPDGALALARNIYENMIVVAFFENKKHNSNRFVKYIEDYYADYDIQRIRALLYESKYCTQNVEETQKLTDELEKTKKRVNHRGNGDYWWAGCKSFSALVDTAIESVDDRSGQHFLHMLHFTYKRACVAIHASCIGNTLRLGTEPDFAGIDTTPTQKGHALPLWFSTTSFIYVMGVAYSILDLEFEEIDKGLNDLAEFFYKKGLQ